MKRFALIFVGLLAVVLFVACFVLYVSKSQPSSEQTVQVFSSVTLTIDFGDSVSTISSIPATTAYDALVVGAKKENLSVTTKTYDFGIFVESIGEKKSSAENAWIFFVNGASGTQAADKTKIQSGDSVEWKYIKPEMQ